MSSGFWRPLGLLLSITLPLYILDQITKWWTVFHFPLVLHDGRYYMPDERIVYIDGYLNWVRVHNTGVAWGMGNGSAWAPYVFLCIPLVALSLVITFRKRVFVGKLMQLAWALLIAGIIGNLTDRLSQGFFLPGADQLSFMQNLLRGYVVDFIDVTIPFINYRWPVFNVADSCVCVAAFLIALSGFFAPEKNTVSKKAQNDKTAMDSSKP